MILPEKKETGSISIGVSFDTKNCRKSSTFDTKNCREKVALEHDDADRFRASLQREGRNITLTVVGVLFRR